MAIFNTGQGSFRQLQPVIGPDRSNVKSADGRILYTIDLQHNKIDVHAHIKWCRRNLGDKGNGWDFWMVAGDLLYIEVWSDKAKFTYEIWKN